MAVFLSPIKFSIRVMGQFPLLPENGVLPPSYSKQTDISLRHWHEVVTVEPYEIISVYSQNGSIEGHLILLDVPPTVWMYSPFWHPTGLRLSRARPASCTRSFIDRCIPTFFRHSALRMYKPFSTRMSRLASAKGSSKFSSVNIRGPVTSFPPIQIKIEIFSDKFSILRIND